jgi:hypothetical protein
MVACGPVPEIIRRIHVMHDAGADHVALIPLAPNGASEEDLPTLEALAERL